MRDFREHVLAYPGHIPAGVRRVLRLPAAPKPTRVYTDEENTTLTRWQAGDPVAAILAAIDRPGRVRDHTWVYNLVAGARRRGDPRAIVRPKDGIRRPGVGGRPRKVPVLAP